MSDCNRGRLVWLAPGHCRDIGRVAMLSDAYRDRACEGSARPASSPAMIALLSACAGQQGAGPGGGTGDQFAAPAGPQGGAIGTGQVKVGLILPLSAPGNAGLVAQSMKNAAELAITEFNSPNIQLLVKDDGGTPLGAQQAAQQALDEGAEIILGPLFAQSVQAVGACCAPAQCSGDRVLDRRQRRGARRVSAELPAGVRRQPHRRLRFRQRQALLRCPGAGQCLWHGGRSRIQASGRAPWRPRRRDASAMRTISVKMQARGQARSRRLRRQADAIFIPDGADVVPTRRADAGFERRQHQDACNCSAPDCGTTAHLLRSGVEWRLVSGAGRVRASRISRSATGSDTDRTRCAPRRLSYDATALVAALVKTQGATALHAGGAHQRFGLCRDRRRIPLPQDGTNERGLAVLRVTPSGGAADQPGAEIIRRVGHLKLSREIGDHRIEHRESRPASRADARCAVISTAPSACRIATRFGSSARPESFAKALRDRCLRRDAVPSADIRRRAPRASAARRR